MRILVLGGTAWVGGNAARAALEAGHEVTCLARGSSRPAPDGVRFVSSDRDRADAYAAVAREPWDGVIDVARHPGHVRGAVAALSSTASRWAFVSTGNVYRSHAEVGHDETAETVEPLQGHAMESMDQYGAAKVACEQAVLRAFEDRAVIARAGLIGGPGDESGRSGYWPWRFAHPSNASGAVLVPESSVATSLIDVRDLARWLVEAVAGEHGGGIYDAIANRVALNEHLAVARTVAAHQGPVVTASDGWLLERGVEQWMGPTSLPLWLAEPDSLGFAGRQGGKILANGLRPRPLAETLADVLAWEEARPVPGPHGAGLDDGEERELLASAPRSEPCV